MLVNNTCCAHADKNQGIEMNIDLIQDKLQMLREVSGEKLL